MSEQTYRLEKRIAIIYMMVGPHGYERPFFRLDEAQARVDENNRLVAIEQLLAGPYSANPRTCTHPGQIEIREGINSSYVGCPDCGGRWTIDYDEID